ncbi:MAG: hypothetical protein HN390_00345 [Anaerolineae bacterium]|mgnify:FL=1|jgi:hypothetical protein|nr:hypothetical protein [Anaerolineae bacterium]MBT6323138.1 hypothetical protein [Anaerolineae bacterium]MBT7189982.1 hypothetical protein [Anaerolineae bacterium]MBT7990680.1 hypothetical protein [Anaerolineae bacterium]
MSDQPSLKINSLIPEQRQKLGQIYSLILSWQSEPNKKSSSKPFKATAIEEKQTPATVMEKRE